MQVMISPFCSQIKRFKDDLFHIKQFKALKLSQNLGSQLTTPSVPSQMPAHDDRRSVGLELSILQRQPCRFPSFQSTALGLRPLAAARQVR
jgi:hypothetical protein